MYNIDALIKDNFAMDPISFAWYEFQNYGLCVWGCLQCRFFVMYMFQLNRQLIKRSHQLEKDGTGLSKTSLTQVDNGVFV